MENFTKMLNAQLILLIYMAVGMYCMKVHIINQETKKKLVDLILKITLPCMIFNSFNKPLTPEVLMQTALILVVAGIPWKRKASSSTVPWSITQDFWECPWSLRFTEMTDYLQPPFLLSPTVSSCGPQGCPCSPPLILRQNAAISC